MFVAPPVFLDYQLQKNSYFFRKLANEDAVNVLRHHTLVPSTKKQVQYFQLQLHQKFINKFLYNSGCEIRANSFGEMVNRIN